MISSGSSALTADKIWFQYRSGGWILKDLTLSIEPGKMTALMGASGSGKTTLLKVLGGLLTPQKGRVGSSGRAGYIPQQLGLIRHLTVLENVLIGTLSRNKSVSAFFGFFPKKDIDLARKLLSDLGIADKENEKVMCLSGGQRQRVAIARAFIQKPSLVLADEFVSDLDVKTADEILSLVKVMSQKENVTFLMTMHEPHLVKTLDGNVIILKNGILQSQMQASHVDAQALMGMI